VHLVVHGGGEEPVPVLAPAAQVVEPMPDVGDHAVQVDDRQRALLGHGNGLPR
jgi:hypothetical protein